MDNIFIPKDHQVYNDLKESDYLQIFNVDESNLKSILRGGALTDIQLYKKNYSNLFRRGELSGAGFWSILNNLARKSLPFLKKYVLPEALNLGSTIIEKSKQNQDNVITKKELKNLAKNSVKNLASKAISNIGGRRKRHRRKKQIRKKYRKRKVKNKFNFHKSKKIRKLKSSRNKTKNLAKFKKDTIFGNL